MEKQILETNVVKPKLSIFLDEVEYRLISIESELELDNGIKEIENFMANNHGFGQSEEIKDELYTNAKNLWNKYAKMFADTSYTFYLNRKQFQFLTTLLRDKLEYDVNTIFLAIELTNMLGTWVGSDKSDKYRDDKLVKGYSSDATEVTYMYHLIAKHKIKGLGADTYTFAEILKKIGDISKIINYYDTSAKNLSKEIQEWVASFEPEEESKEMNLTSEGESIKGKKLNPKKKAEKIDE